MEPIEIVMAFLGALYIVGRGPHVLAPTRSVAYYRRVFSSPTRLRWLGIVFLLLVGIPLIVTSQLARAEKGDITYLIKGFGWIVTALVITFIIWPRWWQQFANSYWEKDTALVWTHRVLKVSFGVFLCWVAFVVL